MRFARLGLDRYGRFTDRELVFDPAARLVVIVGANEAGKTTALNAASDVLFGIDERSRFNFLHDYKDMRLSATLEGEGGRSLSFARLKRRKAALVDPVSDAPLPDDCLAPFVGAHERAAFLDIFGLDQERLRKGGRELLAGGGDLADTLLAAAPGLSHVAALRDRLTDQAGRIFNPGRKVAAHAFYQALDRRKAARDRIRDLEVRSDEVRALRAAVEAAAEARRGAVDSEVAAAQAAAWADLLCRAAVELRRIEGDGAAMEDLGFLPHVPAGFVAKARAALSVREAAEAVLARAVAEEDRAAEADAAAVLDDAVLAVSEAVAACDEERAAVQKAREDLPRRQGAAGEARAGLTRIAVDLGLPDAETLRARMPAAPLLARAEALADKLKARELRAEALATDREAHARETADAETARAEVGAVEDPEPLRRRLVALDGAEERARALDAAFARLKAARIELDERMLRLGPIGFDVEGLSLAPLPALSAAEAMMQAVADAADGVARQDEVLATLAEQKAITLSRLAALDAGGTAPTESTLAAARQARDALWHGLRPLAFGERVPTVDDRPAALALDGALAAADHVADERQRETHRLAELAQVAREITELDLKIAAATDRLVVAGARLASAQQDWVALWTPSGVARPADARAIAFLREVEAIRAARGAIVRQEAEGDATRATVAADRAAAEPLRLDLGLPALGGAPLRMAELRDAVERMERRHQAARDQVRDLARLARAKDDLARRRAALDEESRSLAAEAAELLPPLSIRPAAPAAEVRAALGLWREAASLSTTLSTAEHRVASITRDEGAFADRVAELARQAGDAAGEAASEDAAVTVRRLRQRLDAAKAARVKADAAATELAARRNAVAEARGDFARAEATVDALRKVAGDVPLEALPDLLERLDRAAAIAARLDETRRHLADMCRGRDPEEVSGAVAGEDDATLAGRAADAAAAHEVARLARDGAVEQDAKAQSALSQLDTREGAARAAQEEQDAVAAMAEAVEAFTRDHVAARLLARAIERYREQHQNPIVTRASEAFAALTLGRWRGIGIDYDAPSPRLGAVRDGRLHAVEHLSEGTADQLFLALRIAAIEEHARRAAPLPFMADDLFVTFDEARTEAGLKLLAELGALTQVIVFTHHAHVAEAAVRAVGAGCQLIRL